MVTKTARRGWLLVAERTCWVLGVAGLTWWSVFQLSVATSSRHDLKRFAEAARVAAVPVAPGPVAPDQSLWSPKRISAYQLAMAAPEPAPLAVLRIPKIRLEVAVLPGTDDRTLDRGVGHIDGTAQPGTDGNLGIAGHRDGFFRGLKDIVPGDLIELDTLHGTEAYRIERTWVVTPEDVYVLDPTPTRAITLVTCYPFYFVGSAPERFIVRALRVGDSRISSPSAAARIPCPLCGGLRFVSFFQLLTSRNGA